MLRAGMRCCAALNLLACALMLLCRRRCSFSRRAWQTSRQLAWQAAATQQLLQQQAGMLAAAHSVTARRAKARRAAAALLVLLAALRAL